MKIVKYLLLIIIFFYASKVFAEERLDLKDYQKLLELGYNKNDAYADDYSKTKAYWFTLKEHLETKPKYLALLFQRMKINGKETIGQHIYNSKHHFFGDKDSKCQKKKKSFSVGVFSVSKCEYLKPKIIDDSDMDKNTFAKIALDHCNETKVKNLKTNDGKQLEVSHQKKCDIKFINFSKYEFTQVLKEVGKHEDKRDILKDKVNNHKKNKSQEAQNIDLLKFKKECEELGFKPKTEKFGECVLRLLEASN